MRDIKIEVRELHNKLNNKVKEGRFKLEIFDFCGEERANLFYIQHELNRLDNNVKGGLSITLREMHALIIKILINDTFITD